MCCLPAWIYDRRNGNRLGQVSRRSSAQRASGTQREGSNLYNLQAGREPVIPTSPTSRNETEHETVGVPTSASKSQSKPQPAQTIPGAEKRNVPPTKPGYNRVEDLRNGRYLNEGRTSLWATPQSRQPSLLSDSTSIRRLGRSGRMMSWPNRIEPFTVVVRSVLRDLLGIEELVTIPPQHSIDEEYDMIAKSSKRITEYCPYNYFESQFNSHSGDSTDQYELSVWHGTCRIYYGESDTARLGRTEEELLENSDDWHRITTIISNLEQTLENSGALRVVITRELWYARIPVTQEDMQKPDEITRDWSALVLYENKMATVDNNTIKYIPKDVIERHTTLEIIRNVIEDAHDVDRKDRARFAEAVHKKAPKLFLNFIHKRVPFTLLKKAIDNGVGDENLASQVMPHWLKPEESKHDLMVWGEDILPTQWAFQAVTFDRLGDHQTLRPEEIVPFTEKIICGEGAYSKVYSILLEPSHQKLYTLQEDKNPKLALKQIPPRKGSEAAFAGEHVILKVVRNLEHLHIIRLLATYTQGEHSNFLFPLANCNLENYMNQIEPPKSRRYLEWIFSQLAGLADGLRQIHGQRREEIDKQSGLLTPQRTQRPWTTGYHHDLKPSNILHFYHLQEPITTCTPEWGIFQIADFGVGKIHPYDPKESKNTKTPRGTETYQAPESRVHDSDGKLHISRPYDVWAFGCILMEIATWLLEGRQGLRQFHASRMGKVESWNSWETTDGFFIVKVRENGTRKTEVRKYVKKKLEELRDHPCIRAGLKSLRMLVDLVEDVLEVDPKARITADDTKLGQLGLVSRLLKIVKSAEEEQNLYADDEPAVAQMPFSAGLSVRIDTTAMTPPGSVRDANTLHSSRNSATYNVVETGIVNPRVHGDSVQKNTSILHTHEVDFIPPQPESSGLAQHMITASLKKRFPGFPDDSARSLSRQPTSLSMDSTRAAPDVSVSSERTSLEGLFGEDDIPK